MTDSPPDDGRAFHTTQAQARENRITEQEAQLGALMRRVQAAERGVYELIRDEIISRGRGREVLGLTYANEIREIVNREYRKDNDASSG